MTTTVRQTVMSPRTARLTAGIALALMVVLSVFGVFIALSALVTPGDAVKTAKDIAESEPLFRSGIAALVLVAVLDVIVAGALRTVFEPVSRSVSNTAAWFRIAYAAVFLVAISHLAVAADLVGDAVAASRAIDTFYTMWNVGLILFAVHLLLLGYLAYQSGFMPRIFGVLLVVNGLGYLADGFGTVLIPGFSPVVGQFTFAGEVALIGWLLATSSSRRGERPLRGGRFSW